jgi:hypothetical protein
VIVAFLPQISRPPLKATFSAKLNRQVIHTSRVTMGRLRLKRRPARSHPGSGSQRRLVLDRFRQLYPDARSAEEIGAELGLSPFSSRPRCTELARLGWLERTPEISTTESGHWAHRLRATRAALAIED